MRLGGQAIVGTCAVVALFATQIHAAAEAPPRSKASLWTEAKGLPSVTAALTTARQEHKHVLLQYGSPGCTWCHVLRKLFETDPQIRAELQKDYVYLLVDIEDRRNDAVDAQFGNRTRGGIPEIVILDPDGKKLVIKGPGIVEGDPKRPEETYHISPVTMLKFLEQWAPQR